MSAGMTAGTWLVGASILGSAYIGSEASKDAAGQSAAASDRSAQLQYEQYLQSRQDLAPYREAAVGEEVYTPYSEALAAYDKERMDTWNALGEQYPDDYAKREATFWQWEANNPSPTGDELEGYTGGALNTLSNYGRSRVLEGDYIPQSDIPEYQGSTIGQMPAIDQTVSDFGYTGDIPQFNVQGDIPEFDSTQFDIYKDPSYDWRVAEQERGINRAAAGMGQVTSGNRLEEIMKRSGEMASQEYGAARDRMVQDYGIRRENEATQYGRDVYGYGEDRRREADIYGRATGEYGLTRGAEDARYGRGADEYGRVYGRDIDQYGRDLTSYNAATSREGQLYGRGVDAYGRAYGAEGDYLNRLAALSNIGQTATNTTTGAGGTYAANAGNAITAQGQAQAAGTIGQANAIAGGVGDLTSLYAMSKYGQPPPMQNYYDNFSQYGPVPYPGY